MEFIYFIVEQYLLHYVNLMGAKQPRGFVNLTIRGRHDESELAGAGYQQQNIL